VVLTGGNFELEKLVFTMLQLDLVFTIIAVKISKRIPEHIMDTVVLVNYENECHVETVRHYTTFKLTSDIKLVLSSEYVNLAQHFQHYDKISIVTTNPAAKRWYIKI
jgi:hypothetical protein